MIKSPSSNYIRYLLCQPTPMIDQAIRDDVVGRDLDFPSTKLVQLLRRQLGARPDPYIPADPTHQPSSRYLYQAGVRPLFFPDQHVKLAWELLDCRDAKTLIETALITHMDLGTIKFLLERNGHRSTLRALELFRHYFFNLQDIDETMVRALMKKRGMTLPSDDPDEMMTAVAMETAIKRDPRVNITYTGSKRVGQAMLLAQNGVTLQRVQVQKVVAGIRDAALFRAHDELSFGASGASERAKDYGLLAVQMVGVLEQLGSPDDEVAQQIRAFHLKKEQDQVPLLDDIVGQGSVTSDVMPAVHNPEEHLYGDDESADSDIEADGHELGQD